MSYLLDTHTYLWFIAGDRKLSRNVKAIIQDIETPCYLSIASLWEITIKKQLGKLELGIELKELFQYAKRNKIEILSIEFVHLLQLAKLPRIHGDPFDRLLISQAQSEKLTILSSDKVFEDYKVDIVWK